MSQKKMKIAIAEAKEEKIVYIITGPNKDTKNFIADLIDTTYPDDCVVVKSGDIVNLDEIEEYCLILVVAYAAAIPDIKNRERVRIHIA